jgi:trans-aconitate 2-methyltransferase
MYEPHQWNQAMKQEFTHEISNGPEADKEWDARSYHAVSEPQFEWGQRVLAALELAGNETVLDAGCGTGRLTALLVDRLPRGIVIGVDRSHNMAAVAKETLLSHSSHVDVVLSDLSRLPFSGAFDVIFSTATFHWILDHTTLFVELHSALRSGGRLHAQCGGGPNLSRLHDRAHVLMAEPRFVACFANWQEPWEYASAAVTKERLERAGFVDVETNLEPAPFAFTSAESYRVFVATVVLRTFIAPIRDESLRKSFIDAITAQAAADDPPFELDYVRLNIRARRP